MKKLRSLLLLMLLLVPTLVFAKSSSSSVSIEAAIFMELFVSVHMSLFVLKPLSEIISKENSKKTFWILFIVRVCILLYCDFFVSTSVAFFDFVAVFIGAFVVSILSSIKSINNFANNDILPTNNITANNNSDTRANGIILKCTKCNSVLDVNYKFCPNCGASFDGNDVQVTFDPSKAVSTQKFMVDANKYDMIYRLPENKMVEEFINRELVKAGIDKNSRLIPQDALKRKKILNVIFSILVFVYISLIFFHFPVTTYVVGLVILFVFFWLTRKFNLVKYLAKQLKMRPSEKISNIVMNTKSTLMIDNSTKTLVLSICLAIALPLIIFMNPRILYERVEGGYAVRFYTFGVTNFTSATIPETYKGESVISLRGNTFSNMFFLKEVALPDSIIEIRGQAFKNDKNLVSVNMPNNLEYLGGGAFYNCSSLTHIEMPDTVTYMGGEIFYGCHSLKTVKLSKNISEIRGNSFEECTSLTKIEIPDTVTRIGGHAFYGCGSLKEVSISENSKLNEIGSSAFRLCDSLDEITLPQKVYVNERAFKESPTKIYYYGSNYNN